MFTRREILPVPLALAAQAPAAPNFIVITLDDLGCTDLGCYGARDLKTPHIDALAAGGVRYANWYSNAPVCAPARASILTGRYPASAGVATNGKTLPAQQPTIASHLKSKGYRSALVGKWHLGSVPDSTPLQRGFDEYYGFHAGCVDYYSHRFYWGEPKTPNYHDLYRNGKEIFEDGQYLTERLTEEACAFVKRSAAEPFFLYLAYNAPHYPMHAPQKYLDRFKRLEPERRTYAAMIAAVDDGIGELRDTLQRNGADKNTCIVLLGDNGATTEARAGLNGQLATAGSNGSFRGHKFSLFDGGMHVPCIWNYPAKLGVRKVDSELHLSMDILPTLLGYAGISRPENIDGEAIDKPRETLFWKQGQQLAIRSGKWKLVVKGIGSQDEYFLSDLSADPGETKNLRHEQSRILDELLTQLNRWVQTQSPD
ncbi:sulfatase-like hydrolase/transferase [Bryobacter aggregatus]|uniref:sulfatase-like hydrolase/transferase n=1 Tax=Bryobacter aggregatus TaxID=360054 RepID=UPI0005682279|nr:sulfatase-like hydrolase/transferase [Bryobacter aggregatus]